MLFNSKIYLFIFLPFVVMGYFYITRFFKSNKINLLWLALSGFLFYASWSVKFILLVVISIIVNYAFGRLIDSKPSSRSLSARSGLLTAGILFNLILLGYFKYTNFFIENANQILSHPLPIQKIILPLGISFFTFTQIAYLVDSYKGKVRNDSLLNYTLFVNFFPHLLAGPIIHHQEMMNQFANQNNRYINWENCYQGMSLFVIGLFKKVIIADYIGLEVNQLYNSPFLDFWQAWAASLSYSVQLYFDFSGYSDMALGSALLFNIKLPINFNSPYQAHSIQDFWQRWHMTLSRFLRDYVYIPLGGNRKGRLPTYFNLFTTFLLGGFWHGAGWTYIIWGFLHGIASIVHKWWQSMGFSLNKFFAMGMTFMFVNIAWVFFRAGSVVQAMNILSNMFMPSYISFPEYETIQYILLSICLLIICILLPNSNQLVERYVNNKYSPIFVSFAATLSLVTVLTMPSSFFLYFQF